MKIILNTHDIDKLFKDTNCVVLPEWEGNSATINKTDAGQYYMVRWEEYDPCTDLVDIETLCEVILSDGVELHVTDYAKLV